ncbi:hypothetical protein [Sphingomonas pituitosa]|uniref:hypothetical protein n=1 Tax=Sphingomonas pituitosa TaxID=99597 RepID=UPI00082B8E86|nr:hypothetical protein [Sphingomonas pituitosa]
MKYSSSSIAALAACALLSACSGGGGGGGIGAAPAPGTGGTSPTPAPAPSPTPAPTPAPTPNTSLLALTNSETFGTNGTTLAANYPATGTGTVTASSPTIVVAYDAANGSYTVTSGSRSQVFRPADKDATNSTAQLTVFQRTTGDVTDSLTLTNTGTVGAYRYQYVGGGFWQQTRRSSNAAAGTVDAFTYGVRTPATAVPRTGFGNYAIDLIGVQAFPAELASMAGSGRLDVDFAGGSVRISGTGRSVGLVQGSVNNFDFLSVAAISSTTGEFTGNMSFSLYGNSGSLSGRFYGPGAEEVGATFSTVSLTSDGAIRSVGTITGRKGATDSETLATIATPRSFDVNTGSLVYSMQNARGDTPGLLTPSYAEAILKAGSLAIDRAAASYAIFGNNFTAANLVAAESNARIQTYRIATADRTSTLRVYVPSGSSSELVLNYAGFGEYRMLLSQPPSWRDDGVQTWFTYGLQTAGTAMPRVGSASFTGQLYGNGQRIGVNTGYDLRGTAGLDVAFTSGVVTGTLSPVFTPTGGGASFNYGNLSFAGTITSGQNQFHGDLTAAAGATQTFTGRGSGLFFGPAAEEAALQFRGSYAPPGSNSAADIMSVAGILVARRP